ncbi:hypothetical protein EMIT0194P_20191 [Pseudomonas serbica]
MANRLVKRSNSQIRFLVGAGLLAKEADQSIGMSLTHRFREQARSHIGMRRNELSLRFSHSKIDCHDCRYRHLAK